MQVTVNTTKGESMRTFLRALLICVLAPAAVALAQAYPQASPPTAAVASPASPLTAHSKVMYGGVKAILLRTADKMPEENYSFKPTEAVRTFGQVLGHVA
jgi:hypothetical protein